MTKDRKLKERARARAARTGEPYTTALAATLREEAEGTVVPVVTGRFVRSDDRMTEIVRRFPSLCEFVEKWPFRGEVFMQWLAAGQSSSARHAGKFVLQAWQPYADFVALGRELGIENAHVYFAPFDLPRALGVWDEEHASAFLGWADPARYADAVAEHATPAATIEESLARTFRAQDRVRERQKRRWPQSSTGNVDTHAAMTALARSFPSVGEANGLEPFDTEQFQRWVAEHPEAASTARFLLHVWDSEVDFAEAGRKLGIAKADQLFAPFRIVPTYEAWDEAHRGAFLSWAEAPFWP